MVAEPSPEALEAEVLDLLDRMVLSGAPDMDVMSKLVVIEAWASYLRRLTKDAGRDGARATVVAAREAFDAELGAAEAP